MRVPYVSNPPPTTSAEEKSIVAAIEARRHPRPLQPLDLALLHSPQVALGWNTFVGAVRTRTSLANDLRELAICRIAVVNKAWYEWMHHAPLAVKGGVSSDAMKNLMTEERLVLSDIPAGFTEKQWAVCVMADEMTKNVQVADETFRKLKSFFNSQEIVEIVATISCYNCVSRFLVALDVGERNGTAPELPQTS
ncbi:unnamed protein product [Fusarium venenatum]|uniref:Carboxymuconolactone decarboxylase-like domain-containing protein n=1 Tax=Fusarium venenatum TaxID=56646 RepID=A0A2L2TQ54_9HYPO|nr:uncharacterized protein FVRRES_02138 [Fusarium venenatum]KAH7004738.1 AhpD-like protein [Fusarium venenatum]CEI65626.1 unnamed protein product [Fusarium venenatum]